MELSQLLMTLGFLFLGGLVTDLLGRHTPLPRVTLLILFGMVIGPAGVGVLPDLRGDWFPVVADMALVLVGFLIGGSLTGADLRERGTLILIVSIGKVLGSFAAVALGLWVLGFQPELALILAGISTATAPAATTDVVDELGADGPFTRTLLGIIAIDDAWGLVVFSIALAAVGALVGVDGTDAIVQSLREVIGALLLGVAVGVPAAALTGRIQPGEPTQAEALGVVFLCGGLAMWFEVSFLLAAMALGATVANLARHHQRPFHAIRGIEWPVMILFFVMAGASFEVALLGQIWAIVLAYILLRALGSMLGTWGGARLARAAIPVQRWMGMALLPQAGVALGMALVASQRFPELGHAIVNSVVASTALLELIGPILTRIAIRRAGEAGAQPRGGIA